MKKLFKDILYKLFYKSYTIKLRLSKIIGSSILNNIENKGEGCSFEGEGIIIDEHNLKLGKHISIGRNFFIRATGKVSIDNYTHISRNVVIHTVNHDSKGKLLPYDRNNILGEVTIGSYVWIGMNVNILPGVTIGDGAIIGMGTTITKNISPGQIVVGSAQRVVGNRDNKHTEKLLNTKSFLKKDNG